MPDYITNKVSAKGSPDSLDRLMRIVTNTIENGTGFFQQIDPCPKELDDEHSDKLSEAVQTGDIRAAKDLVARSTDPEETALRLTRLRRNKRRYGATDWFFWKYNHWGVKWDVYEFAKAARRKTCVRLVFETPWRFPKKGMQTAADMLGCSFHVLLKDESGNKRTWDIVPHQTENREAEYWKQIMRGLLIQTANAVGPAGLCQILDKAGVRTDDLARIRLDPAGIGLKEVRP